MTTIRAAFWTKNLPMWERAVRVLATAVAVGASYYALEGSTRWLSIAAALGVGLTGLVGFCPACAMVGRRPQ